MARNRNDTKKTLNTSNKISVATYGTTRKLEDESSLISDIVAQTTIDIQKKFGTRLGDNVVDSFTRMNLSTIFNSNDNKKATDQSGSETEQFKEIMEQSSQSAYSMLAAESGRLVNYENYKAIVENIPEMALARDTYISNILSPDDYTKSIFNVFYTDTTLKKDYEDKVLDKVKQIIKKYGIEEKTEKIVSDCLTYGDSFIAVLPYNDEIAKLLAQTNSNTFLNESLNSSNYKILNEAFHLESDSIHNEKYLTESMIGEVLTESEIDVLNEMTTNKSGVISLLESINKNIHVNSTADLLRDQALADMSIFGDKVDIDYDKKPEKRNNKKSLKKMNINGSVIRYLEPDRVVSLEIGDVCYGYYYIELGAGEKETPYNAETSSMYAKTTNNPMNPTLNKPGSSRIGDYQTTQAAQNLNVTDEKLQVLSGIILKVLGKKFNRKFIENNKEFKDLLYELLRQKYIIEKGVSITYFLPEEVIHFKTDSIFSKITYFAKIYLAVLTNIVLVKLGRSHDKRIFYVKVGPDSNHEQAIAKVIQDVKTKEFRMGHLGSIYTILSLNPGAFDDYYMPEINGERPVDIETIQGMDQDINNEFITFLRTSMIEGTGLPSAILEANDNLEFARQISAQNANFCRKVIRQQKNLTSAFEKLIRLLFIYEYKYSLDKTDDFLREVNLSNLHVEFPSPGSLNLSNLVESFAQVDQAATYIAKSFIPDKVDQSSANEQEAFKQIVVQKMLPQIDWDDYNEVYEKFKANNSKTKLIEKTVSKRNKDNSDDGEGFSY